MSCRLRAHGMESKEIKGNVTRSGRGKKDEKKHVKEMHLDKNNKKEENIREDKSNNLEKELL